MNVRAGKLSAARPSKTARNLFLIAAAALFALLGLSYSGSPLGPSTAHAETFVVTRTDDPVPDGCAVNGCSLREAIIAANADTSEEHVIQLSATTYNLTQAGANEDAAATGDLDVVGGDVDIEVSGGGSATIDANDIDRVFHMLADADLTLRGITVTDGSATAAPGLNGGGIFNQGGTLGLEGSTVSDNVAGSVGGGIALDDASAVLFDSTVSGNTGASGGGGIFVISGGLTLVRSTIGPENTAPGGHGGGISSNGGLLIGNSTISGNSAGGAGGGIYQVADTSATFPSGLLFSTVADNTAVSGGGIFVDGHLLLRSTIVGINTPNDCETGLVGVLDSLGFNLDTDGTCNLTEATDIPDGEADLGPLADNGGLTETRAIGPDSDAIDAGDDEVCESPQDMLVAGIDQRSVERPQDGDGDGEAHCDIGAFELEAQPEPPDDGVPPPDDGDGDGDGGPGQGPIDVTNNNLNLNDNANLNNLLNNNLNTNANDNANEQEQESEQDQDNQNNQPVNVNSSPEVNIGWD